jgi:hypothetical protein
VASVVLVSAAPAGPAASKQGIVIEAKKAAGPGGGTFVLTPVGPGPLAADAGRFTFTVSQQHVVRSGQSVTIYSATSTWAGKQGTMVLRERIEDVAAGSGYRVGSGVWSLLSARGIGQYAGLTGSGRSAYAWTPQNRVFFRFEGFVTKP